MSTAYPCGLYFSNEEHTIQTIFADDDVFNRRDSHRTLFNRHEMFPHIDVQIRDFEGQAYIYTL